MVRRASERRARGSAANRLLALAAVVVLGASACTGARDRSPVSASPGTTLHAGPTGQASPKLGPAVPDPNPTAGPGDPVLVGAGDIGNCTSGGDKATGRLLATIPGTIFAAGDIAYEQGTAEQFRDCFGPAWGTLLARIKPVPGNHDWQSGLTGYLGYFGPSVTTDGHPWYSFDLGAWHVVMLDSDCGSVGGCKAGSPENDWLRSDLAASSARCTVAIFHHPLFSSGSEHGDDPAARPFWTALAAAGAEIVVNGHDHDYERFAPMDPDGTPDPVDGIREFVVGTGGAPPRPFGNIQPNSEARADANGVLKLVLHPAGYDWSFIAVDGTVKDQGSGTCH